MLNQLGLNALLLASVLVPAYIAFKFVRRRRRLSAGTHRKATDGSETPTPDLSTATIRSGVDENAVPILRNNLDSVAFENVTLALTSAASQLGNENVPRSLGQPTPCGS